MGVPGLMASPMGPQDSVRAPGGRVIVAGMTTFPDDATMCAALELAVRAPSVHNTQPWRFRVGTRGISLHADYTRQLPVTDADRRDLVISCGAALHHLRVALAALGWLPLTHRLPDPTSPDHLATVEPLPRTAHHADLALAVSIPRRRTDRRPYLPRAVPDSCLDELTRVAAREGATLRVIHPGAAAHGRLLSAIAEADLFQRANPSYVYELAAWTGRRTTDGIPTNRTTVATAFPVRQFNPSRLHSPTIESEQDSAGTLLVLGTTTDDPTSRLRAGEATSAVLLTATRMRLATCPLTQPLETPATRESIRTGVLDGQMVPQLVLRIGWPADEPDPIPATGRRPITDVLDWVVP
jgi:nitroreductase